MNKNKKNKLTIKSNWDKALTLSPQEKRFLMAGDGGGDGDDCPSQPVGAPLTKKENPLRSFFAGCNNGGGKGNDN